MSLDYRYGDLLSDDANLLVCPVNCEPGVLGAGLAKAFADRWPYLRDLHRVACSRAVDPLRPGRVFLANLDVGRYCLFFPTKDRWREPSRLEWIRGGLNDCRRRLREARLAQYYSVAVPALGCGLGGLRWADVEPLLVSLANDYPRISWRIYPPR